MKLIALEMDLIRKSIQQTVSGMAFGVLWGGPAELLYFLQDHVFVVIFPYHGLDIIGKALWRGVVFFPKQIRSDLVTGDGAQWIENRLMGRPDGGGVVLGS
jgi:hypothetical protein